MNNLKLYEWAEMNDADSKVYVSEGDERGEPIKEGMLMIFAIGKAFGKKYWCSMKVTKEMFEHEVDAIKKMVNKNRDRYKAEANKNE